MMQVIPNWIVTVSFENNKLNFKIADTYMSNVLRKLADISFDERVMKLEIRPEPMIGETR